MNGEWQDWVRDVRWAPLLQDPHEPDITVTGWDMAVRWSRDQIIIRDRTGGQVSFAFHVAACQRINWGKRWGPTDDPECFLAMRVNFGAVSPGAPPQLCTDLDIALPFQQEAALRSLVIRISAAISDRGDGLPPEPAPPEARLAADPPPPPPRPDGGSSRASRHAAPEPANPLVQTVASLNKQLAENIAHRPTAREPVRGTPPPTPARHAVTGPVTQEPAPAVEPKRAEPPRLRRIEFVRAPDDADWLSFCPLATAEEIRAPDRDGQDG